MRKLIAILVVLLLASPLIAQDGTDGSKKNEKTPATKTASTKSKSSAKEKDPKAKQCQAITKKGKQCSRNATAGSKYCKMHAKMMEKTKKG